MMVANSIPEAQDLYHKSRGQELYEKLVAKFPDNEFSIYHGVDTHSYYEISYKGKTIQYRDMYDLLKPERLNIRLKGAFNKPLAITKPANERFLNMSPVRMFFNGTKIVYS